MATFALRGTVDAFPSSDGSIYFLHGGVEADHVLCDPTDDERRLLELLHEPRTREEIAAVLPAADVPALLGELQALGLVEARSGSRPAYDLPPEAIARYDRQLPYFVDVVQSPDGAAAAQRRLMGATVAIVGCGALGSWTAAGLACAGVGRLVLIDDDTVELSNLNRQLLFRHADVGRPKVEAARDALSAFDPRLDLHAVHRRVRGARDVAAVVAGADVVVATADDPPYDIARWINAAALELGVPHVSAAQFPPFVRVGPLYRPGITGCLACQERAARRDYPEYDALVAYRQRRRGAAATLGPLSALVGSVLSTDVMHLLTGLAEPATQGTAILVDSRDLDVVKEPVPREPGCELCGGDAAGAAA